MVPEGEPRHRFREEFNPELNFRPAISPRRRCLGTAHCQDALSQALREDLANCALPARTAYHNDESHFQLVFAAVPCGFEDPVLRRIFRTLFDGRGGVMASVGGVCRVPCALLSPVSCLQSPVPVLCRVLCLVSCVLCLVSCVLCLVSCVLCLVSLLLVLSPVCGVSYLLSARRAQFMVHWMFCRG